MLTDCSIVYCVLRSLPRAGSVKPMFPLVITLSLSYRRATFGMTAPLFLLEPRGIHVRSIQ